MPTVISDRPGYQQRIIEEKVELDARRAALRDLCNRQSFLRLSIDERDLLFEQASLMARYSEVLGQRIAWFDRVS